MCNTFRLPTEAQSRQACWTLHASSWTGMPGGPGEPQQAELLIAGLCHELSAHAENSTLTCWTHQCPASCGGWQPCPGHWHQLQGFCPWSHQQGPAYWQPPPHLRRC